MTETSAVESVVRFVPPEVEGLSGVEEVAIHPDRVEVLANGAPVIVRFSDIARRQESVVDRWLKWLLGRPPYPLVVGEREFCTERRYVTFFANPRLKIHTPPDHDADYTDTYLFRIEAILRHGGYMTDDLS